MDPYVHLLNDDTGLDTGSNSRKIWLAGLTAAKKMLAQRWKPPHDISPTHWLHNFLNISYLERSSARINNARLNTMTMWKNVISVLKYLLHKQAWFICLVVFKKCQLLLSGANGERVDLGGVKEKIVKLNYDKGMSLYVSYILQCGRNKKMNDKKKRSVIPCFHHRRYLTGHPGILVGPCGDVFDYTNVLHAHALLNVCRDRFSILLHPRVMIITHDDGLGHRLHTYHNNLFFVFLGIILRIFASMWIHCKQLNAL